MGLLWNPLRVQQRQGGMLPRGHGRHGGVCAQYLQTVLEDRFMKRPFGCVCSYMAGHNPGILMTGHIGTNAPKLVPPRRGRPRFDLLKRGCANSVVGSELADLGIF